MRRYLDVDLEVGVLNEEKLVQIRERIQRKYNIDLGAIARGEIQYGELNRMLVQKCHLNDVWGDFRRLLFLEKDLEKFEESIERLQRQQGRIIRANKKNEDTEIGGLSIDKQNLQKQKLSEDQVLKLYKEIKKKEKKIKKKELKKISYEDCVAMMEYILTNSRVLGKDIFLQYLMRYEYTQVAAKKYNFSAERKEEKIDCRSRLKCIDFFPMWDSDILPVFAKQLQDILFTQKYIRMFEFTVFGSEKEREKGSLDITRYSYKYIEDIYSKLMGTSYENFYYLNDMLGVSLTNTIFQCSYKMTCKNKKRDGEIQYKIINEKMFDVAAWLGKVKCIYCRDILANIIFKYLFSFNVKKKQSIEEKENERVYQDLGNACDQICDYFRTNIDRINCYYSDLCDSHTWLWANDDQLRLEFDNEIFSEIKRECEEWLKSYIQSKAVDKAVGDYARKSGSRYKIRKSKLIKEPDNLYAQIHMAVMKGIWE